MKCINFILYLIFYCKDCIHYKDPNIVYSKKNIGGFCLYHKDYAGLSRTNEKKCGINGKDFNPRFRKLYSITNFS